MNDDLMNHSPVELSTKPHLRPDGTFTLVTLKQDDNVIQLTPEQAHSLYVALRNHLGV